MGKAVFALGDLGYVGRLWSFLALHNFELDLVALLQTLIAFAGDGAIVNEHVRSIIAAEEAVSLRIVEPLHSAFQTIHVRPPFSCRFPQKGAISRTCKKCVRIVLPRGWSVKALHHTTMF